MNALAVAWLVDKAILPRDARVLWIVVGALIAGVLAASTVGVFQDYLLARTTARVGASLRRQLFERTSVLSLDFIERTPAGDVMQTFGADVAAIESLVGGALPALFRAVLGFVVALTLLYALDWRLAVVSTCVLPLALVYARITARRAAMAADERRAAEGRAMGAVAELLDTHEVVKAFALERSLLARYVAKTEEVLTRSVRASFLGIMVPRSSAIAINVLELLLLALLATFAFQDHISVGTVLSFHALFLQAAIALVGMTMVAPAFVNGRTSFERVDLLAAAAGDVEDPPGARVLAPLASRIDFEGVRFSYREDAPLLRCVDLSIRAGEVVAIVGKNGCGKSTIGNLLMRFQDPDDGIIRFDGLDVKGSTQASLRAQVGYVMQSPVLFDATVRENVRCGDEATSDERIEAACKLACVDTFLPDLALGYETPVGEAGSLLSGGQRQRIALARALVREPKVLLLDEAMSAVDAETEAKIMHSLMASGDRTLIVITHHLRTITQANHIFVIDEGKVVEEGTHGQLLARRGLYARLWTSQDVTEPREPKPRRSMTPAPFASPARPDSLPPLTPLIRMP